MIAIYVPKTLALEDRIERGMPYILERGDAIFQTLFPVPDLGDDLEKFEERWNSLPEKFPEIDLEVLKITLGALPDCTFSDDQDSIVQFVKKQGRSSFRIIQ